MINNETAEDVVGRFETEIILQNKLIELENEFAAVKATNNHIKTGNKVLDAVNAQLKAKMRALDSKLKYTIKEFGS